LREIETGFNVKSGTQRLDNETQVIQNAPQVIEHIHKKVIEEVQPVIIKETIEPHVVQRIVPITERIVEAPIITKEIRPAVFPPAETAFKPLDR